MSEKQEDIMTHANLAENASAGNCALVESGRLLDVNLIKLVEDIGYFSGEKKIYHLLGVEVGPNSGIRCPSYLANVGNIDVGGDCLQKSL